MKQMLLGLIKYQRAEQRERQLMKKKKTHPGLIRLLEFRKEIFQRQAHYDSLLEQKWSVDDELYKVGLQVEELSTSNKKLEERIYSGDVKNPKEIAKLQEKHREHKSKITNLEDRALALLEEQEKLMIEVKIYGRELSAMKRKYNEERLKIKAEIDRMGEQLQKTRDEMRQIQATLSPEIWAQYKKVKTKKTWPVAALEEDQCTGCRMRLPIMLVEEVKMSNRVVYCENCGRILVYHEEVL